MSIIRVRRPRGYTVIPDATLRDSRLSLSALGLLVRLLSRPDGWEVRPTALARECQIGRDALRGLLRNLEQIGYLVRRRTRDAHGRWDWESEIYDTPPTIAGISGNGESVTGGTADESTSNGAPGDIYTTDSSITESSTTTTTVTKSGGSSNLDWSFLRLSVIERTAVEDVLAAVPPDLHQDLLDELAGAQRLARGVDNPPGFVRGCANKPSFKIERGLKIRYAREERRREAERAMRRERERIAEAKQRERQACEGSPARDAALAALPPSVRPRRLVRGTTSTRPHGDST